MIIQQFIYAKMPRDVNNSIKKAHLANVTYVQIVLHLEKELELRLLEVPDERLSELWRKPRNKTLKNPNRHVTTEKKQVNIGINAVTSK